MTHLIYCVQVWTQTSVHAEHSAVHDGTQREIIKYFTTPPPNVAASVFPLAFVIEAIDLCDLSRFMVSADEGYPLGVPHFKGE